MNPRLLLIAFSLATIAMTLPAEAARGHKAIKAAHHGISGPAIDIAAVPAYPTADQARPGRQPRAAGRSATDARGAAARPPAGHQAIRRGSNEETAARIPDTTMLPHPAGCPGRQFCACGAAVDIFGEPRRDLWKVSTWYGFDRTMPAAGMVAIPHAHHLFVLDYQISGSIWMTRDYNSGKHQSRKQAHDIAGMTIVNPHSQLATRAVHRHRLVKHHQRHIGLAARR